MPRGAKLNFFCTRLPEITKDYLRLLRLPEITNDYQDYQELPGITKGLPGITKGLPGITRDYYGLLWDYHGITAGLPCYYQRLPRDTGNYQYYDKLPLIYGFDRNYILYQKD